MQDEYKSSMHMSSAKRFINKQKPLSGFNFSAKISYSVLLHHHMHKKFCRATDEKTKRKKLTLKFIIVVKRKKNYVPKVKAN